MNPWEEVKRWANSMVVGWRPQPSSEDHNRATVVVRQGHAKIWAIMGDFTSEEDLIQQLMQSKWDRLADASCPTSNFTLGPDGKILPRDVTFQKCFGPGARLETTERRRHAYHNFVQKGSQVALTWWAHEFNIPAPGPIERVLVKNGILVETGEKKGLIYKLSHFAFLALLHQNVFGCIIVFPILEDQSGQDGG